MRDSTETNVKRIVCDDLKLILPPQDRLKLLFWKQGNEHSYCKDLAQSHFMVLILGLQYVIHLQTCSGCMKYSWP
jgi:hypothetical protein